MNQTVLLRKMTGEQRLTQGIKLSELVRQLSELGKKDNQKRYKNIRTRIKA